MESQLGTWTDTGDQNMAGTFPVLGGYDVGKIHIFRTSRGSTFLLEGCAHIHGVFVRQVSHFRDDVGQLNWFGSDGGLVEPESIQIKRPLNICLQNKFQIWGFPEIGVPQIIIHF